MTITPDYQTNFLIQIMFIREKKIVFFNKKEKKNQYYMLLYSLIALFLFNQIERINLDIK